MATLYKFSKAAYWYRIAGFTSGPLIQPLFVRMQKGSNKERMYGDDFIAYLKRLNPDPKSIKLIMSPTYGPSKGIQKNGKLRFIMAAYPGPGDENLVLIDKVVGKWGKVIGLPENHIPSAWMTHDDYPWLIHKVYGSNLKFTASQLNHDVFVPVMSDGRYIQMKWLERI